MHNKDLNYFKKKKNVLIVILSFSFLVLLTAIIVILGMDLVNNELVMTLYFLGIIAYLVLIVYLRTKIIIYIMNYRYYQMIVDDLGNIELTKRMYTPSWVNTFYNDGFKKGFENNDMLLLYQFYKKLPNLGKTGYALVVFVISKNENYNFYNDELSKQIEYLYRNYEYERRVKKQIIVQFKKYETFDQTHKDELQEIMNYRNGDQVLINIPVGYFVESNQAYYLRPNGKYNNKFHYYTSMEIEKYMHKKGDE